MLSLRSAKRYTLLAKIAILFLAFGFALSLLHRTSFYFPAALTDKLYTSGIVHSEPIVCDDCFQYLPVYTLDSKDLCREDVFLLILVTSRPTNSSHRRAIRETWASRRMVRGLPVKVAFLAGQVENDTVQSVLDDESRMYNDIIQADFIDSYRNLTYKSITALQWAMRSCSRARYLLKTDDDTFVNIERVVAYLRNLDPREDFIGGNCFTSRPIRDPTSKWYVKPDEYTKSHYPMYCNGFSYVMPMTTVARLVSIQPNVPFLYIEDVYITGMCRNVLRIPYRNMASFVPSLNHISSHCQFVYHVSTAHYVNETMLYSLHSMITDQGFIRHCLQRRSMEIHPIILCSILTGVGLMLYVVFRKLGLVPSFRQRVVVYRTTHLG